MAERKMDCRIPTVEEIYEECHREAFFAKRSVYPKRLRNFGKILTDEKRELLVRFQDFIRRNFGSVDWRLYVKACVRYYRGKFDLKLLGSLAANRAYRMYVSYSRLSEAQSEDGIYCDILNSIRFIRDFSAENGVTVKGYFSDREGAVPIAVRHIYAGTVSLYFYACLDRELNFRIFGDIPDDVFYELFNVPRNEFLSLMVGKRREAIAIKPKVASIINSVNCKFKKAME